MAFRRIPEETGEEPPPASLRFADSQFHGKRAAVHTQPEHGSLGPDDPLLAGAAITSNVEIVLVAVLSAVIRTGLQKRRIGFA